MHKSLDERCAPHVQKIMVHLADYMAQRGLSDEEVATGISRSRPTVSRIRRRLVRPDWETLEEIKKFTNGVSTADDYQNLEVANEAAQ
ncbi:helix-turn-helix domain-containing protein [uncultured Bradyrhizobium sp.]|uniref:helix-turn-helix domain-containing protein n=1 Tax=uncultured Bradyrhizobium sp. TaxID=199684 RepID=UPI0035CA89C5